MAFGINLPWGGRLEIGGTGGNIIGGASDAVTPFFEDSLNTWANSLTAGLVGYGREGARAGWTGEMIQNFFQRDLPTFWGDLTGKPQLEFYRQQVEAENLRRQMEREQMLWQQEQADISASRAAGSAAQFGAGRGRGNSLRLSSSAPYLEQDFLGL